MNDSDLARAYATTLVSTIFLILAILVILSRSRTSEMKLVLIGIFMTVAASVQSGAYSARVDLQQVALATGLGTSPLMKIAVILTLAGVGMMFMSRVNAPAAATATEKERPHVD